MPVVTGVDVLGIQRYVFGSNRLRDVLAASWMVDHVTAAETLKRWENHQPAQVLLAAGGNAIMEFPSIAAGRAWTALYTRWLQETAPGLEVVVAHRPYEAGHLAWALKALQIDLAVAKTERVPGVPQLGLSVTAPCHITGLPATQRDQDGHPISARIAALRQEHPEADDRWNDFLPVQLNHATGWSARFPTELDRMGRSRGDTSRIGVVHIDGDGIGALIQGWLENAIDDQADDATVRTQYSQWSQALQAAVNKALRAAIDRAAEQIRFDAENGHCVLSGTPEHLSFRLHHPTRPDSESPDPKEVFLPLRPILLGGDDLTFVCDGRLALDLAATALHHLHAQAIPHLGNEKTMTACAGVAIVKAHAPFHRSYELAESLCRQAKTVRSEQNDALGINTGCWIDWHIGSARPGETVDRQRHRIDPQGALTMRPYPLTAPSTRPQSWEWIDTELLGPGRSGGPNHAQGFRGDHAWKDRRNRIKRLAATIREGRTAITQLVAAWRATDSHVALPGSIPADGHCGQATPLLDAIELLDLHLRLERDTALDAGLPPQEDDPPAALDEEAQE